MASILQDRIPFMEEVLAITGQPGVSIGVIHQGKEVFKHNFGVIDVKTGQKTNSDTIYCIASLTKAFVAAGVDLLIQENGMSWDTKINSIIDNFHHKEKPDVYAEMTLRDMCSHRTGLQSLDEITQGLGGRILIPKKDVVTVSNSLPSLLSFRSGYLYNNAMYALAGRVIEQVTKAPTWGDFLHDRIFSRLEMSRTTAFPEVHQTDKNIAKPYVVLTDGTLKEFAPPELSARSMNGGSGGMRSSVNDLLKWCHCLLLSFHDDQPGKDVSVIRKRSPIFERCTIANGACPREGDYCTGWCHHQTPTKLGLISPNRFFESAVVGEKSPSIMIYGHQGDVWGYTCNLYIIPESDSAIIVLSNGTGLSDSTDWIAQDLIQTLHQLEPAVNFLDAATKCSEKYQSHYYKALRDPLMKDQVQDTQPPSLGDLVGKYIMDGLDLVDFEISLDPGDSTRLHLMVCKQKDQIWKLWHYNYDVFCFLPDSYDSCLSQGYSADVPSFFLIPFTRNSKGAVDGLRLNQHMGGQIHFTKAQSSSMWHTFVSW